MPARQDGREQTPQEPIPRRELVADVHAIRLTVPKGIGRLTTVELDGVPLRGVTAVSFAIDVDHMARVTLEMYADLVIEGDAEIVRTWRQALPWWRRLPYWTRRNSAARRPAP